MKSNLSPETELVLLLCRTPVVEATRNRVLALLGHPMDWNAFLRYAAGWDVEAVVCSNLRDAFFEAIPPTVLQTVAVRERESRANTLARTLVTVSIAGKLEELGIPAIVLKGPAVGIAAYGDPSLRPFADIDMLVRKEDLRSSRELLLSLGYRPEYASSHEQSLIDGQHALEFSDSGNKVELHWALLSRHLRLDIPADELWSSSIRIPCAGRSIRVLAPEHLLIFLCAHGAKHEWERLRWIFDIAQILQRIDPDSAANVVDIAARTHSKRLLALGVRLARDIAGVRPTSFPEESLPPEADTRRLVELVRQRVRLADPPTPTARGASHRLHPGLEPILFWASTRERMVDRVASVAHLLFVPTVADEGPHALRWARRPVRLASRFFRGKSAA